MALGEALPRPRRLVGSLGSSLSLASLPPSETSHPPPSRPPPSRHRSHSRAPPAANTPSGVGAAPRVPPPSLSAESCEPPDDSLRSSEALPPPPPPPPPQPKGVESSGWREEDLAQMGEKVSEPPLGVSDAFARLEREALSGGVGAFARLEREALRMEEMGTTTDLGLLRRNVQQLQADARVHVLLERDERKELERQRAKINELQQVLPMRAVDAAARVCEWTYLCAPSLCVQAFHSLANLIVGEMEDIRVAQRKQQAQIDRIMTTHRDLATLEQEEWAACGMPDPC